MMSEENKSTFGDLCGEETRNAQKQFDDLYQLFKKEEYKLLMISRMPAITILNVQSLLDTLIEIKEKYDIKISAVKERLLYLHRANIFLHFNNYSEALFNYEKVKEKISKEDSDFELHWLKAMEGISWIKARTEHYSEALKDCNELIKYAFDRNVLLPKFFIVRACCYKELGNNVLSERDFNIAQLALPFQIKAYLETQGDIALDGGMFDKKY